MLHPDRNTCVIEMTPPRRDSRNFDASLRKFSARFNRVMESGFETLMTLRQTYPHSGNCMSMINFNDAYAKVEEYWKTI